MEQYLSSNASIIKCKVFEDEIYTLQKRRKVQDIYQREALRPFLLSMDNPAADSEFDYIHGSTQVDCMDVNWIPPRSDYVERFFSQAKLLRTDRRKAILSVNFEMVIFLKMNAKVWEIEVSKVVNNNEQEDEEEANPPF